MKGMNLLLNAIKKIVLLRRNPDFFDAAFYKAQLRGVGRFFAGISPRAHYVLTGWKQGHNPHPFFDGAHYLFSYPDVASGNIDPLSHYIVSGASEARRPNVFLKPDHYILSTAVSLNEAFPHYTKNVTAETRVRHSGKKLRLRGKAKRIDDYARATNQRVIDMPQEAVIEWLSPRIINRNTPQTKRQAPLPKPYVAILKNVTAFPGTRLLLTQDEQILHDELAYEDSAAYHDKLKAIGNSVDGICAISAAYIGVKLDRALLISSDTDFNYFHFLSETLPKLHLAQEAGCPADIPILMQSDLHTNLISALTLAAGGRKIIYAPWGAAVEVEELWYVGDLSRVINPLTRASDPAYDVALSPRAINYARDLILKDMTPRLGERKIYMSRSSHYRHLGNQDAFMDMLQGNGFQIIDTGRMSLSEQIEAMQGAGTIIAPSGASLTNLLWCAKGTRILILMADHPQLSLALFNQMGQALGLIVELYLGERIYDMNNAYSFHDSFEADLNVISTWCDQTNA